MLWIILFSLAFSSSLFGNISSEVMVFNKTDFMFVPSPEMVQNNTAALEYLNQLINKTPYFNISYTSMEQANARAEDCKLYYFAASDCFKDYNNQVRQKLMSMSENDLRALYNDPDAMRYLNSYGLTIKRVEKTVVDPDTNQTRTKYDFYIVDTGNYDSLWCAGRSGISSLNILLNPLIMVYGDVGSLIMKLIAAGMGGIGGVAFIEGGPIAVPSIILTLISAASAVAIDAYKASAEACIEMTFYHDQALNYLEKHVLERLNSLNQSKQMFLAELSNYTAEGGCYYDDRYCEPELLNDSNLTVYLDLVKKSGGDLRLGFVQLISYIDAADEKYRSNYSALIDLKQNITQEIALLEQTFDNVEYPACEAEDVLLIDDFSYQDGTPAYFCEQSLTLYRYVKEVGANTTKLYLRFIFMRDASSEIPNIQKNDQKALTGAKVAVDITRRNLLARLDRTNYQGRVYDLIRRDINRNRATLGETYIYLRDYNIDVYEDYIEKEIGLANLIARAKKDDIDVAVEEAIFRALNPFSDEYLSHVIRLTNQIVDKANNKYGYLHNLREQILRIARGIGAEDYVKRRLKEIEEGPSLNIRQNIGRLKEIDQEYRRLLDDLVNKLGANMLQAQYDIIAPEEVEPNQEVTITVRATVCNPFELDVENVSIEVKSEFKELFGERFFFRKLGAKNCSTTERSFDVIPVILQSITKQAYLEDTVLYVNETASLAVNYDVERIVLNGVSYEGNYKEGKVYTITWGYTKNLNVTAQDAGENQTHKFARIIWKWGDYTLMGLKHLDWEVLTKLPMEVSNGDVIELAIADNNTTFMRLYREIERMNLTEQERLRLERATTIRELVKLKEDIIKRIEKEKEIERARERLRKKIAEWESILQTLTTPIAKKIAQEQIDRLKNYHDNDPLGYTLPDTYVQKRATQEARKLYSELKKLYNTPKAISYLNSLYVNASAGKLHELSKLEQIMSTPFTYNKSYVEWYKKNYVPEYIGLSPKEVDVKIREAAEKWLFDKKESKRALSSLEQKMKTEYERARAKIKLRLETLEELGADVTQAKEALERGDLKQAHTLAKKIKPPKQQPTVERARDDVWLKLAGGIAIVAVLGLGYYYYKNNSKPKEPPKKLKSIKDKLKKE